MRKHCRRTQCQRGAAAHVESRHQRQLQQPWPRSQRAAVRQQPWRAASRVGINSSNGAGGNTAGRHGCRGADEHGAEHEAPLRSLPPRRSRRVLQPHRAQVRAAAGGLRLPQSRHQCQLHELVLASELLHAAGQLQ